MGQLRAMINVCQRAIPIHTKLQKEYTLIGRVQCPKRMAERQAQCLLHVRLQRTLADPTAQDARQAQEEVWTWLAESANGPQAIPKSEGDAAWRHPAQDNAGSSNF